MLSRRIHSRLLGPARAWSNPSEDVGGVGSVGSQNESAFTGKSRRLRVASGDYGFLNKTEEWLANGQSWAPLLMEPRWALGRSPTLPGGASLLRVRSLPGWGRSHDLQRNRHMARVT